MSHSVSCDQETRLHRIVRLIGLPEEAVRFAQAESREDLLCIVNSPDRTPVVVELRSRPVAPQRPAWIDIRQLAGARRDILLFGTRLSDSYQSEVNHLGLESAEQGDVAPLSEIRFSNDALWGPLQGLCASWPLPRESSPIEVVKESDSWHTLLSVRDEPWFCRGRAAGANLFLWNSKDLPDITERIEPKKDHCDRLLRLLPLLVFCRHAFGKRCWHLPASFANLIVDDPPVRDRYGFFSPQRHLASLADIPHATTVAFIPWNWNRSTAAAADLFRFNQSQLSLCIHGCDHTKGEFASLNEMTLSGKCRLALERAELFRQRTGLSCAQVMVFPQGFFTKAAMAALRETNFLAAVNSTLLPVDSGDSEVCLADLFGPALTRFADFPLFLRRYPRDPVLCAVDLFLGRHLLIVEHHSYFQDRYAACRQFLKTINSLQSRPVWAPLDQIVRQACLQREVQSGKLEVRFYTNLFALKNSSTERLAYRLVRQCTRPELIREVLVNEVPVECVFESGQLFFSFELEPQSAATVRVVQNGPHTNQVFKGSLSYRANVWCRRSLCDLRDNHAWLSKCARWTKRVRYRPRHSV